MYRRRSGELTNEFREGMNNFLLVSHANLDADRFDGKLRCPCKKCKNCKYLLDPDIRGHLYRHGFVPCYERWTCHGEPHTFQPFYENATGDSSQGIGRGELLNDYIQMVCNGTGFVVPHTPSNVNDDLRPHEEPNPDEKLFYSMLVAADKDLWPGCKKMTLLSTIARLLNIKAEHNLS